MYNLSMHLFCPETRVKRVALIRRIALDWVADGADRKYQGHDEKADTGFVVEPA